MDACVIRNWETDKACGGDDGITITDKTAKGFIFGRVSAFSEIDASRDLFVVDPLNLFTQKAATGRSKS